MSFFSSLGGQEGRDDSDGMYVDTSGILGGRSLVDGGCCVR